MAVRGAQAIITYFRRTGILCLVAADRTCVAHGLPEAPDTFTFTPLVGGAGGQCMTGWFVESWDATSIVFVNSANQGLRGYVDLAVVHSHNR